jgi:hypothetical protein
VRQYAFFNKLEETITDRSFWSSQKWQMMFLCVIVAFWWRQGTGVLTGHPPLLGWMVSAETSIVIVTVLTWELFTRSNVRQQQYELGMLLVQFCTIIVGNSVIVALEIICGVGLTSSDWVIFGVDGIGLAVIGLCVALGRLRWKSPWAKCWYAVVLKAAPQLVQAWWLLTGKGSLDSLGVVFLIAQGTGRVIPAFLSWKRERATNKTTDKARAEALFTSTGIDLATILVVAFGAVAHEMV